MFHEVLETDVQFARALMQSHQGDKEIISALRLRGVEAQKAAQLVNDLRHNVPVKGLAFLPEARRAEQRLVSTPQGVKETATATPAEERRPRQRRKPISGWGLVIGLVIIIFLWALGYCLLHDENNPIDMEKHDLPTPPSSKDFDEKR